MTTPVALNAHPAAQLFPLMSEEELAALVADIEQHGQREPIITLGGKVLDGRNRWTACLRLGITPQTREWDGHGSPVEYVLSTNLHRRHLSASQKAMIAVDAEALIAAEIAEQKAASARQRAQQQPREGGRFGERTTDRLVEIVPQSGDAPPAPKARDIAAKSVGVNPHYVSDAKRLAENAPELAEAVRAGERTLLEAKREYERATMAAVVELAGDPEGHVARARLRAAWAKAVHQTTRDLFPLSLDAVFATFDESDYGHTGDFLRRAQAWLTEFEQRYQRATAPALRVVGGTED